jgi:hypothetical protein
MVFGCLQIVGKHQGCAQAFLLEEIGKSFFEKKFLMRIGGDACTMFGWSVVIRQEKKFNCISCL